MKWADYQSKVRYYDLCTARFERSIELFGFESALVNFLENEFPNEPEIHELKEAMIEQFPVANCGSEPEFFN